MRITADTNVLIRAVVGDNKRQSKAAQAELAAADMVAIALPALCEFVWVLSQGYKVPVGSIATTIRMLVDSANVSVNRQAVDAGLAVLEAGGDFADGVIEFEGRALGAHQFVSFDRQAVKLLGDSARLLK
jgi:predicted nucleic-acid-binding protein